MRILHVTTLLPQSRVFGGGVTFPIEIARAQSSLGHRLTVWGVHDLKGGNVTADTEKIRFVYERSLNFRPFHRSNPCFLCLPIHLMCRRYDRVHFHQWRILQYRWLIPLVHKRRMHVGVTDLGGGGWRKQPSWLPKYVDRFYFMSHFSKEFFYKPFRGLHGPEHEYEGQDFGQFRIVGGGFDPDVFFGQALRKEPTILYVGRIAKHKGLERAIGALQILLPRIGEINLRIVGINWAPGYEDELKRRCLRSPELASRVHFIPPKFGRDLVREYLNAACLILPSTHSPLSGRWIAKPELFGIVLVEAMAVGLPVVCTDIGGMAEVCGNGKYGYMFPDDASVEQIAEIITDALYDKRGVIGPARKRAWNLYTWEKVAKRCLEEEKPL